MLVTSFVVHGNVSHRGPCIEICNVSCENVSLQPYSLETNPLNSTPRQLTSSNLPSQDIIALTALVSLRKQPTFHEVATWALAKRRLSNERRNSILMTCHYPDLGSASDWLNENSLVVQPIRSATKIWVVTRHQYGISALVTQTSFCEGSSGDLAKRRLFSQSRHWWVNWKAKLIQSKHPRCHQSWLLLEQTDSWNH